MQQAVRRLSIEATTRGVKEATADAKALSGAVDGVAVSAQRAEKSTQSLEGRLASIQRKYDEQYRAQQQLARVERDLAAAQAQGLVSQQRRLELLSLAAQRHGLATAAMNRETVAIEQQTAAVQRLAAANDNAFRRRNLTYQLFDISQGLALGSNPALIAMQQGPQIAQLYAGAGGVNAALKDTGSLLGGIASKFGPVAVAAGVAALALVSIRDEAQKATDVAVTLGDTLKATYQVITRGIYSELEPAIGAIAPWFEAAWEAVATAARVQFNETIRIVMFAIETIKYGWSTVPDALIAVASTAAQGFVDMMVWMARETVVIINGLLTDINGLAHKAGLDDVVPLLPNPNKLIPDVDVDSIIGGSKAIDDLKKRTEEYNATIEEIAGADYWGDLKKAIADQAILNAQERLNEAIKDQVKVEQDRIAELKLDIELVGKSAGEVARLTTEHERLAAAKAAAEKDGRTVSQGEIDRIKAYAAEVGKLTEQLAVAKAMDDITFERGQIGRTDDEREIYEKIRSIGVDINSDAGKRLKTEMEINRALQDQVDSAKELADALREGAASFLEDIFTGKDIMESLVSLGSKFASINFDKFVQGASNWFNGKGFTLDASDAKATAAVVGKAVGEALAPAVSTAIKGVSAAADAAGSAAALGKSIAAGITPSIESSLSSSMDAFAAAIRKIESGSYAGNYGAIGPMVNGDRAYGAYQVMGANIGPWSKEVLGQVMTIPEFLADSNAQDKIFYAKFGQSLDRWGNAADAVSVWFTGRPNAVAGGSVSDGFNTNAQYQAKFTSALAGVPDAVKSGAAAGTETGSSKGVETGIAAVQQAAADQSGSSTGGLGQGALGLLGLGFGAFSTGYQSADPMMGALGGAVQGFGAGMSMTATLGAAAGPIGAAIGGIVGLISGLFGQSEKEKEEMEKAKEELESQIGAITKLIRTAAGEFVGIYEEAFLATSDEITKAAELAKKAGDDELAQELEDSLATFFETLGEQWKTGLEAAVEYGIGSPFAQAVDAVFAAREQLIGFVDDAKFFTNAAGDVQTALDSLTGATSADEPVLNQYDESYRRSGSRDADIVHNDLVDGYMDLATQVMAEGVQAFNESGAQLYTTVTELRQAAEDAGLVFDETGQLVEQAADATDDYAGAVADAAAAAQQAALDMLNAPDPLTDIQQQLQTLYGTAAALPDVLEELGMTAEEAAAAVDENLTAAIAKLAETFTDDLNRSINDLSDKSYLNDIGDALDAYNNRLDDAAALGVDLGSGADNLARQELVLAVTEITKQAELTADQINALSSTFPELVNVLQEAAQAAQQATSVKAVADAIDDVEASAEKALDDALGKVKDFFNEVADGADRMRDFAAAIADFQDSIKLNADVSTLSPQQRLDEARQQFESTAAKAAAGDTAAMDKLTSSAQSYLDEAKGFFGSTTGYVDIFNRVNAILGSNETTAVAQADYADQQLDYARQQVDGLDAANDNLRTLDQAIGSLRQSVIDFAAAETQIALAQEQVDLARQQIDELEAVNDNVMSLADAMAALALATADYAAAAQTVAYADPSAVSPRNTPTGTGNPYADLAARFGRGFAGGGYTGDGGINEIAGVTHGREYVFDAAATARIGVANLDAIRSGSGNTSRSDFRELAKALFAATGETTRAIREEMAALREDNRQLRAELRQSADRKQARAA